MNPSTPDDQFRDPRLDPSSAGRSPEFPASPIGSERPLGQPSRTPPTGFAEDAPAGQSASFSTAQQPSFEQAAPAPTARDAGLPTSEVRARRESDVNAAQKTSARLLWLFALLALFVLVRFNLSPIVEEVQYALTRGEQRAESDHARAQLQTNLSDASEAFRYIYQAVGPSVVHIDVATRLAQNRPGPMNPPMAAGQGSGVIVEEAGYIVTNYHVIEGAQQINVKLSDGRTIRDAEVIGVDKPTDLAVLKIDADGLVASPWGSSDELRVGDWVVAVGNPFGLDRSVTAGIVSAKRREGVVRNMTYQSFLQTDAAVNPGNSGGPLVNLRGEVIGITTAIVGDGYQGISLAIPSDIARDIYQRLRDKGAVERGWLGIEMDEVSPEEAMARNIPPRGVRVKAVVGEPAILAGLRVGDIITKWNDTDVKDRQDLMMKVAQTEISSVADVEIIRDEASLPLKLQVSVGERTIFQ